ncbi:hypothetical protein TNCT_219131 [Trichonephila clavata]|uniref:Uncharacterized protein n=1 Tax=Trichonephila clavata TaxID=2740835 RepID=A0A8X6GJ45_TRICU|nr:hypothetical protein TNCT_219131 [Trichonephila clavata]
MKLKAINNRLSPDGDCRSEFPLLFNGYKKHQNALKPRQGLIAGTFPERLIFGILARGGPSLSGFLSPTISNGLGSSGFWRKNSIRSRKPSGLAKNTSPLLTATF